MTLDDQIAILQAAKEGKEIQTRPKPRITDTWGSYEWYDALEIVQDQAFNFAKYEYRVKPTDRKVQLFLTAPGRKYPLDKTYNANCEATFNAEGELIRVELL